LYSAIGRHEQALEAYRQTLAIFQSLANARPHVPEYQKDLAGNFNNLGALYSDIGRNQEAKAAYRKALAIQKKLAQTFPQVPEYQRDLAGSYNNLGVLHAESGKSRPAETAFQKALSIRKKLLDAWPRTPEYKKDLAGAYKNLGAWASNNGRWHQAEAAFLEALAVQKKLARSQPEVVEYLVDLGATYNNLGDVMRALGKIPSSNRRYSEAIQSLKRVLEKHPRQGSARKFLRNASWGRAKVLALLGRHDDAIQDWQRAMELDHGQNRTQLRIGHCKSQVLTGSHHRATAEACDLIKASSLADRDLFDLATVFSVAATAAWRDFRLSPGMRSKLAEQYAAQGVELLERTNGNRFFQEPKNFKLLLDKDLDYLTLQHHFGFDFFVS
jgi:tetratricopeptide (TPR) repeat protein